MNIFKKIIDVLYHGDLRYVYRKTLSLENYDALCKRMLWDKELKLEHDGIYGCDNPCDINERRLRDAEVLAGACANVNEGEICEIGTSFGNTTALMADNAPKAQIYTVNLPPEECSAAGDLVTHIISREEIGSYYKHRNYKNIHQIYANTLTWEPQFEDLRVAFIDGCHDRDFVYNDTIKILRFAKPGTIILWHDFNPELVDKYDWINEVCQGVGRLIKHGHIKDEIYHLKNSFVGLYKVR